MPELETLTPELRIGTRALEGLEGFEWDGQLRWDSSVKRWVMRCSLEADVPEDSIVPRMSSWWVHLSPSYPLREPDFLPAKDGGIKDTFPHQNHNAEGDAGVPWRKGKLCLRTDITALKRRGYGAEPKEPERCLAWNVERARQWIVCASRAELLCDGDPFDLPDYRFGNGPRLAFSETTESFEVWKGISARSGLVTLLALERTEEILVVNQFTDRAGRSIHGKPSWGGSLHDAKEAPLGVWVLLEQAPIMRPWKAPATWLELCRQLQSQGTDLVRVLPALLDARLRGSGEPFGKRPPHPFLIGFPIPKTVGGPGSRIHWTGFKLPPLAEGAEAAPGFRNNQMGRFQMDQQRLRSMDPLPWFSSQSWSDEDLIGRGSLPPSLRDKKILLIGAGSLGSQLAEILVRGGSRFLIVMDGQDFEAGNLVRHTLGMKDVGENKALALASRLNLASPWLDVVGIDKPFPEFPSTATDSVDQLDLVFDCSASDEVVANLNRWQTAADPVVVSLSIGLFGKRLYCHVAKKSRIQLTSFSQMISPWLEADWKAIDPVSLPRDGLGCWNPLLPVGIDDVALLTASAVKHISDQLSTGPVDNQSRFTVFERIGEDAFEGIRIVEDRLL